MASSERTIEVDIVSDVVCPWCFVGFRQLEAALAQQGLGARIRWHPFELNPDMPPEGQNLREHLTQKYGISDAQSAEARRRLREIGAPLGIAFDYREDMRIVNTFAAHRLLDWAEAQNLQHPLKLALFSAYFTEGADVSDPEVLTGAARRAGLDAEEARGVLENGAHAGTVRARERFWTERGITGVPAMVFDGRYLVTGAQGVEAYAAILARCASEAA